MKKGEKQQLRNEARARFETFWNDRIKPLHEAAAAAFTGVYQAFEEKEHILMQEISPQLGLDVDDVWVAYSLHGMPAGKYLACHAVEDREGQEDWPAANGMVRTPHWKYRQVRFLPYDSKLAYLMQRRKAQIHREHMSVLAQEYAPYFEQIAAAWQEIGADDYLAARLARLMTFKEVWNLAVRKIGGRVKQSLDPFRKLHNIPPLSFREELEQSGYPVESIPKVIEPRNERLEQAAESLGVKPHVLQADIKELAWSWEGVISNIDSPSPPLLLTVLGYLVKSYLRGRNFRMGNYKGFTRHAWKKTAIVRLVIDCAAKDNVLESLHKAGVTSADGFRDAVLNSMRTAGYDILEDIRQFLEKEEEDEL